MGAIWSRPADMPALTAPVIYYLKVHLNKKLHLYFVILSGNS